MNDEKVKNLQEFKQVRNANKDAIVLHCLPAYRGKEITNEVIREFY